MNCPECHSEIPDGSKFCKECGSSVSGISGESAQERPDESVGRLRTLFRPDQEGRGSEGQTMAGPPGTASPDRPENTISPLPTIQSPFSPRPSTPDPQSSSDLSARYELGEEIGRGGFARVWKARDRKLDRIVAVKRLLDDKLEGVMGRQTIERFEREATAIAQLNHRNVVMVYDHDEDDDGHYVVMEYVEGGTLRDYLKSKGGKLPVPEAIELIKGIAQGLGYAHRKNLVHRDIKPANVLLHKDGDELTPKIVDFGLARIGSESELSMSGYGMGTPWYMPPEQRRNAKGVNHTADIYALGKVLYELVSGETPDNVDPEKIPEPWLVSIILKCIKSSPEERYFSCEDLVRDLAGSTPAVATARPSGAASDNACPQCGAATPEDAKFCEGCGAGLTRLCPECERENSVHKKFCAGCGTDVAGFLALQDTVGRMEKYLEAKKYSRVLKEAEQADALKFNARGEKGKALAANCNELRGKGDEAAQRMSQLRGVIEGNWKNATDLAPIEAALTSYAHLADELPADLHVVAERLPARKELARVSGALDAAGRVLQGGDWREGQKTLGSLMPDAAVCKDPEDAAECRKLTDRREALLGEAERLRQQEIETERARMDKAADDNDWESVRTHAQRLLALCPGDEAAQRGIRRAGIEGRRIAMVQRAWDALNAGKYDVCQEACRKAVELVGEDFRIEADGFSGLCTELAALAKQRAAERAAMRRRRQRLIAMAAVSVLLALGLLWLAATLRTGLRKWAFDQAQSRGDRVTAAALAQRLEGRHAAADRFLVSAALDDARAAQSRQDWRAVLAAADRALALDANNRDAQAIRQQAREQLLIEGQNWTSPATGMEFVWIPAMNMWVGRYEVTNEEYRRKERRHNSGEFIGHSLNNDRQPVVQVNFDDAKAYAEWLTQQDRAVLGGARYRLPSEQEWTAYAQCGDNRTYPWGNEWPPRSGQAGNYSGQESPMSHKISSYNDGFPVTAPVDRLWANPWGLYGVGGNVWEVCARDGTGQSFGAWRGASWLYGRQDALRVSARDVLGDSRRLSDLGFRLVLSRPSP